MVVHYDPWWNLAAQNQATDRAHRIGQQKNVTVYKLITKDSIEERSWSFRRQNGSWQTGSSDRERSRRLP